MAACPRSRGRAFFDGLYPVGICRNAFCFMAAPSVGRRSCAGKRKAAALIVQSRRWSYGRVKRAAVRRLFFLGRRPAVDYVDYIERKIAIPQKTESAESVPGY